jgi:hypothetical protein
MNIRAAAGVTRFALEINGRSQTAHEILVIQERLIHV